MKRLIFLLSLFTISATGFCQFSDTAALNAYIRDSLTDRRPQKLTPYQFQKAFLGVTSLITNSGDTSNFTVDEFGNLNNMPITGNRVQFDKMVRAPYFNLNANGGYLLYGGTTGDGSSMPDKSIFYLTDSSGFFIKEGGEVKRMVGGGGSVIDTTSLSNRIGLRAKTSDVDSAKGNIRDEIATLPTKTLDQVLTAGNETENTAYMREVVFGYLNPGGGEGRLIIRPTTGAVHLIPEIAAPGGTWQEATAGLDIDGHTTFYKGLTIKGMPTGDADDTILVKSANPIDHRVKSLGTFNDALAGSSVFGGKLSHGDTAAMLAGYLKKVSTSNETIATGNHDLIFSGTTVGTMRLQKGGSSVQLANNSILITAGNPIVDDILDASFINMSRDGIIVSTPYGEKRGIYYSNPMYSFNYLRDLWIPDWGSVKKLAHDSLEGSPTVSSKLNKGDTAEMLSKYLRKIDTLSMLSPYLRKAAFDTATAQIPIRDAAIDGDDTTAITSNAVRDLADSILNARLYTGSGGVGKDGNNFKITSGSINEDIKWDFLASPDFLKRDFWLRLVDSFKVTLATMIQLEAANLTLGIRYDGYPESSIQIRRGGNLDGSGDSIMIRNRRIIAIAPDSIILEAPKLYLNTGSSSTGDVLTKQSDGTAKWATPSGGGGGSGTVNSGISNRLGYYASSGTAISSLAAMTANRLMLTDANGLPVHSIVTNVEVGYLSGITSGVQSQINAKAPLVSPGLTGTPTAPTAPEGTNTTQVATTAFVKMATDAIVENTEGIHVLEFTTTDATPFNCDTILIANGSGKIVEVDVVGTHSSGNSFYLAKKINFFTRGSGGSLSSATQEDLMTERQTGSLSTCEVVIGIAIDGITPVIKVTGQASTTIDWKITYAVK